MSPVPLIARQRALSRIGEIRCGDEKHDGKVGRKLETFRLTSQHKDVLERAAELYGGEVKEWESPTGSAWQVITTRSSLPVLVIPGYSLRRSYEKWAGPSKRERICDGEEQSSGEPCLCNAQCKDECKLLTRLMVLLPETGTSLGWQLSSTGETAADELDLAMKIAEGLAYGRPFVPATLSLTQRKGQLDGKATRFVVPVLGFDPTQNLAAGELPAGRHTLSAALPAGYIPIAGNGGNSVSVQEGLTAAQTQTVARNSRSSAPIPEQTDLEFGGAPVPPDESGPSPSPETPQSPQADGPAPLKPTPGQKKKIGVFIKALRDEAGVVTNHQLWANLATARGRDVEFMILGLDGRDDEGVLHFGPLLADLTREEASRLIDWFERVEAKMGTDA